MAVVPKLVVFDLDACCWSPEMYMLIGKGGPPFTRTDDPNRIWTVTGEPVKLYSGVRPIWRAILHDERFRGTQIAIASRCDEPEWARELLTLFEVDGSTTMAEAAEGRAEIYRQSKQVHFGALQDKTGIAFDDMLFFDDDPFNISDVGKLGVTCVLTPDGLTAAAFQLGLLDFAATKSTEATK
mmetsp:Transcript_252/g.927  ORF Transcript_252/g.927 Transcript_252/m.927 type:complete len:183 (+) Transcript_252:2728-3276(+)